MRFCLSRYANSLLVVAVILLGIVTNICREIVFAILYGTNDDIELFRLYFSVPTAIVGLVGTSFVSNSSAYIFSDNSKQCYRNVLNVGVATSFLSVLIYCVSIPIQIGFLFKWEYVLFQVPTGAFIFGCMAVFILAAANGFWIRSSLLGHNHKVSSVSYTVLLSATPVATIMLQSVFFSVPTVEELAVHFAVSSSVVFLFYLIRYKRNQNSKTVTVNGNSTSASLRYLVTGIFILSMYRLVNNLPRFLDRGVLASLDNGSVAALEYSFSIISIPVLFMTVLFTYIGLQYVVNHGYNLKHVLVVCIVYALVAGCAVIFSTWLLDAVGSQIFIHGEFTEYSYTITKEILDIHIYAVVPLTVNVILGTILVQTREYTTVIVCVVFKLLIKYLSCISLYRDGTRIDMAATFVISEYALLVMLIFSCVLTWQKIFCKYDKK